MIWDSNEAKLTLTGVDIHSEKGEAAGTMAREAARPVPCPVGYFRLGCAEYCMGLYQVA